MLHIIQTHSRLIFFGLLLLLGLSIGRISSSILDRFLGSHSKVRPASISNHLALYESPEKDGELVLERNLFGSVVLTVSDKSSLNSNNLTPGVQIGDSDIQLLGTVVSSAPFAIIGFKDKTEFFREGDLLGGHGRIEEITRNLVKISKDGEIVFLRIKDTETPSTSEIEPRSSGGIKDLGGDRWVIDRETAENARKNIATLLKSARIEPNLTNGQTDGFVVKMIKPGSLLSQIGLQVGDVIRRVNGLDLDSPEKALQIFQQLREARNLSLQLERKGTPLSFEYQIN